jgi:prevent-host-death family protein
MTMVNVHEAKTQLSRLLERGHAGEEIVIAKAGIPCARLVPLNSPPERVLGRYRERDGDVPDSFFEPLDEDELAAWES